MSATMPGRHRAPSRLSAKPLARASVIAAASGGLVLSMSGGAQSAPAPTQPVILPAVPITVPAAPITAPAAPRALPMAPVLTHPTTPSSTWTTIRWGARGSNVETVQRIVGAYPDGIFGPKTHAAVQRYQTRNNLVPDGIVGPLTSRAMGLGSSGSTQSSSQASPTSRETSAPSRSSSRTAPETSSAGSSSASAVLAYAEQYTGIMYSWGGSSPSTGFDCSGYTQFVFAQAGIYIPRTTEAQRLASTPVSNPQPGDLVFWGAPAYHNAIYAGDGMIYDSGRAGLPSQKRKMFSGVTSFGRVG
ncbi:MAG: NlpC/P60 family protein [Actinomycetota bacterium]|jgi:cell wall-associated NlpC family hydrolase|nr:NlpC/P60 family protein [Actinomycetota bacterium]MDQ3528034.1 NlpC/P60 family protein [Actinomycetota bacterium]